MLKGCSRRELSARRRRKPCLANTFSTGKLQKVRREKTPSHPGWNFTRSKMRGQQIVWCDPLKPHVPQLQLSWSMHGAAVCTQAPGTCPLASPVCALGPGLRGEIPAARVQMFCHRPKMLHLSAQFLFPRTECHCSWETEHPCAGQDHTSHTWSDLECPCSPCLRDQAQSLCSLPLIYDKKCVSWEVQDVELALSQDGLQHSPTLEMLAGKGQRKACSWPKMPFGCILIQIQCGCEYIPGSHWLDTGSVVPSACTSYWYQHLPVTAQSSLLSQLLDQNPRVSRVACALLALAVRPDIKS